MYNSTDTPLDAYNFGPEIDSKRTVFELAKEVKKHWHVNYEVKSSSNEFEESQLLFVDSTKAKEFLKWRPVWGFEETVRATIEWYKNRNSGSLPLDLCCHDIDAYNAKINESRDSHERKRT